MRIARLLIYTGSQEDLDKHLAQAKPDGMHYSTFPVQIRITTLPSSFLSALSEAGLAVMKDHEEHG